MYLKLLSLLISRLLSPLLSLLPIMANMSSCMTARSRSTQDGQFPAMETLAASPGPLDKKCLMPSNCRTAGAIGVWARVICSCISADQSPLPSWILSSEFAARFLILPSRNPCTASALPPQPTSETKFATAPEASRQRVLCFIYIHIPLGMAIV